VAAGHLEAVLGHSGIGCTKLRDYLRARHHEVARGRFERRRNPYLGQRSLCSPEISHGVEASAGPVSLPLVLQQFWTAIQGQADRLGGGRKSRILGTVLRVATRIELRPQAMQNEAVSLAPALWKVAVRGAPRQRQEVVVELPRLTSMRRVTCEAYWADTQQPCDKQTWQAVEPGHGLHPGGS
jgi:hypothetical protein